MPTISFRPSGISVEVISGTTILDAARLGGIDFDAPCGGNGTCGKCLIYIVDGDVEIEGIEREKISSSSTVLACKTKVLHSKVTVDIPPQSFQIQDRFDDSEKFELSKKNILGSDTIQPLSEKILYTVPAPEVDDGKSDLDRLHEEIENDKGTGKEIICPLSVVRKIADTLRKEEGRISATVMEIENKIHIIDIESGHSSKLNYGIAVDVGTTTVSVQLIDLVSGKIASTISGYNDQIPCGLDVISRINYATSEERRNDLQNRILRTLNRLIETSVTQNRIAHNDITCSVISGNTVMIHLLLGLDPEQIRLEPYTPTVMKVPFYTASEIGITINENSIITLSPAVGSYVGGDIVSGLLCTDIITAEEIVLFIDIGTNGELVIGNSDFMLACACSAGPAFEGGGISCGMRATDGAINSVTIDPLSGKADSTIIGDKSPKGICGSGMIDLIAELFITGWIDESGKLNREKDSDNIITEGRKASFLLASETETGTGSPITITESDIENIIRAKAAIYSASLLLLSNIGIDFRDVKKVYIAGGFGKHLDIEKAITIGLFPDIAIDRYTYLGNTSLLGSTLSVLSSNNFTTRNKLAENITYVNLSNEAGYMDQYTAALFIPHTDFSLFPSVKKR